MLEVCGALMREHPGVLFQTHMNESAEEIVAVRASFPWAESYLAVYERFGLVGPRSVFAHNVHASDTELTRLAAAGAAVAHCPGSNSALGAGIFPMQRHLAAGVRFALGTDVGAGVGFGMLKEALLATCCSGCSPKACSSHRRICSISQPARARRRWAWGTKRATSPGKSADLVRLRPPKGTPLASAVERAEGPERILAALIAQAGAESVREVRVRGAALAL
jgi:guanine deaminase